MLSSLVNYELMKEGSTVQYTVILNELSKVFSIPVCSGGRRVCRGRGGGSIGC